MCAYNLVQPAFTDLVKKQVNLNHNIKAINPGNTIPIFLYIKPFTERVLTYCWGGGGHDTKNKKIKPCKTIPASNLNGDWLETLNIFLKG